MSQYAVETAAKAAVQIRTLVRIKSDTLTTHCRQAGLPLELAELCGGLLATVADDLNEVTKLKRTDLERSKRLERILMTAEEPYVSALRIAIAASPLNGRACVRHWDTVCDQGEQGRLAWLLGVDTEQAWRYGKRVEARQ